LIRYCNAKINQSESEIHRITGDPVGTCDDERTGGAIRPNRGTHTFEFQNSRASENSTANDKESSQHPC
jgi:hypothetical protein